MTVLPKQFRRLSSSTRIVVCLLFTSALLPAQDPTASDCALGMADTWQERQHPNGLLSGRSYHTAVWTGSEMIVWGGDYLAGEVYVYLNDGARYNPATNSWTPMSSTGAPSARSKHTAVWTGTEMIVWGGHFWGDTHKYLNDGARYNPANDTWTPISGVGAPEGREVHTAVWTGREMIVWGGNNYDGESHYLGDGGRYNPASDSWTVVSATDAPSGRYNHTAVWTGSEMIVWGGFGRVNGRPRFHNDGGRYDPAENRWTPVTTDDAPIVRDTHSAVWTGQEMIVWGGRVPLTLEGTSTGGRYNPAENSWSATSTTDAPSERFSQTAVWTGNEMIVWGGTNDYVYGLGSGGRYRPATNQWKPTSTTGAPLSLAYQSAAWTGSEMIIWGGFDDYADVNETFAYTPECQAFRITSIAIHDGNALINFPTTPGFQYTLWQSDALANGTWTDTGLPAVPGTGASMSFSVPLTGGTASGLFRVHANR